MRCLISFLKTLHALISSAMTRFLRRISPQNVNMIKAFPEFFVKAMQGS